MADYKALKPRERELFAKSVREINVTYAAHMDGGGVGVPRWPTRLRIQPVTDAPGIFELTWSFSGPDGRATFEYRDVEGEPAIVWRRIGGHGIFKDP
jgi:hypothetical protein